MAERDPRLAARILELHGVDPRDVFVIVSSSGGNGATVEMARLAREHGHTVVAITSLRRSRTVTSRHPSGHRLGELADIVIDNGSAYDDAALEIATGRLSAQPRR